MPQTKTNEPSSLRTKWHADAELGASLDAGLVFPGSTWGCRCCSYGVPPGSMPSCNARSRCFSTKTSQAGRPSISCTTFLARSGDGHRVRQRLMAMEHADASGVLTRDGDGQRVRRHRVVAAHRGRHLVASHRRHSLHTAARLTQQRGSGQRRFADATTRPSMNSTAVRWDSLLFPAGCRPGPAPPRACRAVTPNAANTRKRRPRQRADTGPGIAAAGVNSPAVVAPTLPGQAARGPEPPARRRKRRHDLGKERSATGNSVTKAGVRPASSAVMCSASARPMTAGSFFQCNRDLRVAIVCPQNLYSRNNCRLNPETNYGRGGRVGDGGPGQRAPPDRGFAVPVRPQRPSRNSEP